MELKNLVQIKSGKRIPKGSFLSKNKNDHPYIKVKDMQEYNTKLTDNFEYVPDDIFKKINKYIVNTGDIILSIVGTIGNVSIIDKSLNNASLTENCVKFVVNDKILNKYLYYFLISPRGKKEIQKGIIGSTQPKLPFYNIEKIDIPYIEIEKQQHIVNTIGSVDELIENYQSQADKICQALEQALSVHDDRCLINEYDPFIIKSGIVKFDKEKTYLDTSCVEGINNISSGELITYSKRPSRANMQPIANSVWFAKMKDSNKIIIVTDSDDDLLNKHILSTGFMGIQATQSLPMSLLTAIIISNDFKVQRDLNSVGTTMAGVNNETFLKIQVPKLNETEINDFENKYSPLVSQLSYLRRKIILLKGVKDKLLKKYF